ncbi:MAG: NAD-dependent epimerase/dehydratase family protein [Candidatus Micrarchaeota archaeon]
MKKILVTGASGQIGSELVPELRKKHGNENVISLDLREPPPELKNGPFEILDATNKEGLEKVVNENNVNEIYHLVGILSAAGEKKPDLAWKVNMESLKHVLDIAKEKQIRVFWPSSIAAFGPTTPRENTPQRTILEPSTIYGISKVAGELLCNYYYEKFGVDVRSVRFPGILSWKTPPGGGTTDYAVAIFYDAIQKGKYNCFVKEDTVLPMMYMPDAVRSVVELMAAPGKNLTVRTSYNLAAISFSAKELAEEVKKKIPNFECTFSPDERQKIADSWPKTIDDSAARKDWNWNHEYDLPKMADDMHKNLLKKLVSP